MEDGEVEELYEYYEELTKEELVDKILEIILYQKDNLDDKILINELIGDTIQNFEGTFTNQLGEQVSEEQRLSIIGDIVSKMFSKYLLNLIKDDEYQKHSNMEKEELVELLVEHDNNKKVGEYQENILKNISEGEIINFDQIKESKDFEYLLLKTKNMVARYENKIIKYEGYDENELGTFNSGLDEIFVGTLVTNHYEGFVKVSGAKIMTPCPDNITYEFCSLINENYILGKSLGDWIISNILSKTFSLDLYSILLKVFENLSNAYKDTGFTHYDLHTENIMIDEFNNPTIIDYGYSYVRHDDKNCGQLLVMGEIYNRPMWLHDVFKILFSCLNLISQVEKFKKNRKAKVVSIMKFLQACINKFLASISISLDLFGKRSNNYTSISIQDYFDNYNSYFAPTKEIQDKNEITFDGFITIYITIKKYYL